MQKIMQKGWLVVIGLVIFCSLALSQKYKTQTYSVITDNFTDSNGIDLVSHNTGFQWLHFASSNSLIINNDYITHDNGHRSMYVANKLINLNSYQQVKITRIGVNGTPYIIFRAAIDNSENWYSATYDISRKVWYLISAVPYESVNCIKPLCNEYEEGNLYFDDFLVGQSRDVKVTTNGNLLTLYINNVKVSEVIDLDHPNMGYSGIGLSGDGFIIDDFEVGSLNNPSPSPSPSPTILPSPSPSPTVFPGTTRYDCDFSHMPFYYTCIKVPQL